MLQTIRRPLLQVQVDRTPIRFQRNWRVGIQLILANGDLLHRWDHRAVYPLGIKKLANQSFAWTRSRLTVLSFGTTLPHELVRCFHPSVTRQVR